METPKASKKLRAHFIYCLTLKKQFILDIESITELRLNPQILTKKPL